MEYVKDGKIIKFKMDDIVKIVEPTPKSISCRKCGCGVFVIEDHQMNLQGYGIRCAWCNDYQWTGKLNDKVKRKNPNHKEKHFDNGIKFCWLCQLTEEEIKSIGQHLTVDHIQEIQNGGEDKFKNTLMICNSCHYLKNALSHKTKSIRKLIEHLNGK